MDYVTKTWRLFVDRWINVDSMLDFIGGLAYISIFAGQWEIGKHNKWGWWLRIAGGVVWAILGYLLSLYSVLIFSMIGVGIDLRSWYRWNYTTSS